MVTNTVAKTVIYLLIFVSENGNGPIIDKHKVEIIDNANQRQFSVHFHNFVDLCLEKEPIKR